MRLKTVKILCTATCLVASLVTSSSISAEVRDIPCDVQRGSCSATTEQGASIDFDIRPKPVAAMTDLLFSITVRRKGNPVDDATVGLDLGMPGMYMGKNKPVMKHAGNGRYEGKGLITRCASGRKTWRATITIQHEKITETAAFVFEVK